MPAMNDSTIESDRFNLQRFVDAQAPVYSSVLAELRAGLKSTHWMWFIFPQHASLGRSETARYFGSPDDLKLRSSMTLFALAASDEAIFARVLDRYWDGRADERTLALIDPRDQHSAW